MADQKLKALFIVGLTILIILSIYHNSVVATLPEFITDHNKILIIPIEFDDMRYTDFQNQIDVFAKKLPYILPFSNNSNIYSGLTVEDYFREVSYGKYQPNFTIVYLEINGSARPFHIYKNWTYYPTYWSNIAGGYGKLFFDIPTDFRSEFYTNLAEVEKKVGPLDQYQTFVIVHPGYEQQWTHNPNDMRTSSWYNGSFGYSLKGVTTTIISCSSEVGPIAHELGHSLRLLDLYDKNHLFSFGGKYSLMADGSWLENGTKPPQLFSIEKYWLGWLSASNISMVDSGKRTIILSPLDDSRTGPYKAIKIPIDPISYYVLEYRRNGSKAGLDEFLPSNGVLLYKVNESLPNPEETSLYGNGVINVIKNIDSPSNFQLNDKIINITSINENLVEVEISSTLIDMNQIILSVVAVICISLVLFGVYRKISLKRKESTPQKIKNKKHK